MFGGDKDLTKVKTKTKITQNYKVPLQDPNIPTTTINQPQTNLPISQPYQKSSNFGNQCPTVTSLPMGGTNLNRRQISSSSSSSSSQKNKNKGEMMGNFNQFGQPSTLDQTTLNPTGNIQTGYGPSSGFDTSKGGYTASGAKVYTGNTNPLGKNLYGETGYATSSYQPQEPFPGQTVYVEKSSQKMSKKTKEKFDKPVI